jgi:predicted peptidase
MAQQAAVFESPLPNRTRLNYLLHIPASYEQETQKRWPLILFLHGSGERGDDPHVVKAHGVAKIAERDPEFPFIAVSPQCPPDTAWSMLLPELNALCEHIVTTYRVDPDQQYLTGLSMGGFGVWSLAAAFPNRFAALAPVCGGLSFRNVALEMGRIKHIPVWVFHGKLDDVVPVKESESAVAAFKAAGGDAKLTVYPLAMHDSWTPTYDNPELYAWFLSHRRH